MLKDFGSKMSTKLCSSSMWLWTARFEARRRIIADWGLRPQPDRLLEALANLAKEQELRFSFAFKLSKSDAIQHARKTVLLTLHQHVKPEICTPVAEVTLLA